MKRLRYFLLVFICLTFIARAQEQTDNFDLTAYQQFLRSHQDMSTAKFFDLHPAGLFEKNAATSWQSALYHDSIEIKYKLTNDEIFLLNRHGFLVTERLSAPSFGNHFLDIWWKDLPVFISTDAILYAFHFAYDRLLAEMEMGVLIDRLGTLLKTLHNKQSELAARYSTKPAMDQMFRDVDVYLTVPLILLGEDTSPAYTENSTEISEIITLINKESYDQYPFFSENCKEIDFSQFKPRGHYTNNEQLQNYFKAMMWLGRIEVYLLAPQNVDSTTGCPPQTFADIQRQTIDAVLIKELMDLTEAHALYSEIEAIISFFVGEQDNVTADHLNTLVQEISLSGADALLDSTTLLQFQQALKEKSYAFQRIQSQLLYRDPFAPESIQPASSFMLFGQRFVIDSQVTSQVVFDKIIYNHNFICRLFPSTLDVIFSLGNNAAGQLLGDELDQYKYAGNLSALRYLVDSYDEEFWTSSIYNMWLHAIRALNPPADRQHLPAFMQTAGWWQQKMNTQLASWAELRHDNLLYAKPSYTSGIGCSYPCGYVEPVPQFFQRLNNLAEIAVDRFGHLSFSDDYLRDSILDYFVILRGVTDTLGTIAQKELAGLALSNEETAFIRQMIHQEGQYGGGVISGWYGKLLYGNRADILGIDVAPENSKNIVADFHTTPTDCDGNLLGWVSHAGTGPVDIAIIAAPAADGHSIAFAGPVSSYFEYRTTNFLRLTDAEWNETYQTTSTRPDWVNLYLADSNGKLRAEGASLVTSLTSQTGSESNLPAAHLVARNFPNPFNPATLINFVIPSHLTNSFTELIIYDIQGKVIRHLVAEDLPGGNYLTKWDGTNDAGRDVASGQYFYNLRVGDYQVTGKMNLLR
jgi:hypothetical protein